MPRLYSDSPRTHRHRPVIVDEPLEAQAVVPYQGQPYGPPAPEERIGDVGDPPPPPIPEIRLRSEESIANYVDFCYRQIQIERDRQEETSPLFLMSVAKYTFFVSFVAMTLYLCYNGSPGILGDDTVLEEVILTPCWLCNTFGYILRISCSVLDGVAAFLIAVVDILKCTKITLMQKYSEHLQNRVTCTDCMFNQHQAPHHVDVDEMSEPQDFSDEINEPSCRPLNSLQATIGELYKKTSARKFRKLKQKYLKSACKYTSKSEDDDWFINDPHKPHAFED